MTHKFGDLFNPPGLTNFLGASQVEFDITGISSLNFPPLACGNQRTAMLFINKKYFPSTGIPITFTWYPQKVVREAVYNGFYLKSTTILVVDKRAAIVELRIENRNGSKRNVNIRLGLDGGITKSLSPWNKPQPPDEQDNNSEYDKKRQAVIFSAKQSSAVSVQGALPKADKIAANGLEYSFELSPGKTKTIQFVNAVSETLPETLSLYDSIINDVKTEIRETYHNWKEEIKAVFTPGNSRYSGSLPILETNDDEVLRLYLLSILGVIYFKRDNPDSVYGRAYDTLLPMYWQTVTFIWDYALSSFVHALLDPQVMKKYLEKWMLLDIYNHFGTDYLTGSPIGNWYSANDFNMMVLLNDYLRWSGDYDWLNKEIIDTSAPEKSVKRVVDYIEQYALSWKRFKSANGLADYGKINNLLECVSSYIHEVASLNAANVYNMRKAAEIISINGQDEKAREIRKQGNMLVNEVQKLYADGKGYWNTRFPDGSLVDVQHCYDFFTILNTISDDLSKKQQNEMVSFFKESFQTPTWMHALAPGDTNAMYSERPDHQWNGAYPAWPAHSLKALYRIGKKDVAYQWLKGLAKTFNQGPLGQAHFVETFIEPEDGGARKSAPTVPYMTDWACSGGGSWVSVIIESLFGVTVSLDGQISAEPQFSSFDPKAELHNLNFRGKSYNVAKQGLIKI